MKLYITWCISPEKHEFLKNVDLKIELIQKSTLSPYWYVIILIDWNSNVKDSLAFSLNPLDLREKSLKFFFFIPLTGEQQFLLIKLHKDVKICVFQIECWSCGVSNISGDVPQT